MFYSPSQTTYLNYAMVHDPSLLPSLYNSYSTVSPIDPNQSQQYAQNREQQYMNTQVAPRVAGDIASGGATDNSFAASRSAADKAQMGAYAQGVYNDSYNSQNQRQEELQAYNQSADNAAWKGYMGAYAPQEAKTAGQRPSQWAEMGNNDPLAYLYGNRSQSPQASLGQIESGFFSALGNPGIRQAAGNFGSGFLQGVTGGNGAKVPFSSQSPFTVTDGNAPPPVAYDGAMGGSYGQNSRLGY